MAKKTAPAPETPRGLPWDEATDPNVDQFLRLCQALAETYSGDERLVRSLAASYVLARSAQRISRARAAGAAALRREAIS